jgi:tetratricopeptide (TPR) repeat protein
MKTEWLDAHAQLLSVPPVFDEPLVSQVDEAFAERLVAGAGGRGAEAFRELRLAGLVVREQNAWRLADPLRGELRRRFQRENLETFQAVADSVVEYGGNGLRETLSRTLGVKGAEMNLTVLRVAAKPEDDDALNSLVDLVERRARSGRESDATSAAVLLSQLPATPARERHIEFLLGLAAWREGERGQAREHFSRVLRSDRIDRAAAVAAHLTGVALTAEGSYEVGIPLLQRSVDLNRQLSNQRGLALVLLSLGGARRDFGAQLSVIGAEEEFGNEPRLFEDAEAQFEAAIEELEEAFDLAEQLGDERLISSALLNLATTYQRQGNRDLAIELAEASRELIPDSHPDIVRVHTVLGSLYKDAGDHEAAATELETAARLGPEVGIASLTLAKLLNVLASNERRTGQLEAALSHVRLSVAFGRDLDNARHLSQALHTLATVLADAATTEEEFAEAEQALDESEGLLRDLHDTRGLEMLGRTRNWIREARQRRLQTGD